MTLHDATLRLIVHTTAGGSEVRIRLSNAHGSTPLAIGAARIALRLASDTVVPGSDRKLTFGHDSSVVISPGSSVVSDPAPLAVSPLSDLAVSLYLPGGSTTGTSHFLALQTSYVANETTDMSGASAIVGAKQIATWPFLAGVDVLASADAVTVVGFGDSLVDGAESGADVNHRWTDVLAARLNATRLSRPVGVVNAGIIGNRLLRDTPAEQAAAFGTALGERGLARFERDVLAQPGVSAVIVRIGVNDLGFPGTFESKARPVTAAELISGYRQLIRRAHARRVRIVGMTISPFGGAKIHPGFATPEHERERAAVNRWMRGANGFDAVVDVDAILRDPEDSSRLNPTYDSGDHLHTNDAGYRVTAAAIPLDALLPPSRTRRRAARP
jgi:lysophospholipase L1-like esterase